MKPILILSLLFLTGCNALDKIALKALYPYKSVNEQSPPTETPANYSELMIEGTQVWTHDAKSDRTIVFCNGNGMSTYSIAKGLNQLFERLGVNLIIFNYPHYGRSKGTLNQKGLVKAASLAVTHAKTQFPESRIYVWGWSIGAAVATQTALKHQSEIKGLILSSAFNNLKAMASEANFLGKHLSDEFLKEHGYQSDQAAKAITLPVLMHHGDKDSLIPLSLGQKLAEAFSTEKFVVLKGRDHGDIFNDALLWQSVSEFLNGGEK